MLEINVNKILNMLKRKDKVLDIGGWAKPFNRANYVVDIHSYDSRGFFGSQGGRKECFTKKTWVIHDLSSKKKLPFKNKQFDFVICSHTLEDIRDPIFLCSELIRVAKKGYIEFPSEKAELSKGIANKKYAGYYHHRWLISIKNNNVLFRHKPHSIHTNWKFHFPKRFLRRLSEEDRVSYLFWDKSFNYAEIIQISRDKVENYIKNLIKREKVYPLWKYNLDEFFSDFLSLIKKIKKFFYHSGYYHRFMDTEEYFSR